jgi:hypothetical protein
MNIHTIRSVIAWIGREFRFAPYTICGTAALAFYGCKYSRPEYVSMLCAPDARKAMIDWAGSCGMERCSSSRGDTSFCFSMPDGAHGRLRMHFTHGFHTLRSRRLFSSGAEASAYVLSLTGLANTTAAQWVKSLPGPPHPRQGVLAKEIRWILREIAAFGDGDMGCRDRRQLVPCVLDIGFYAPFTLLYPGARQLLAAAGMKIPDSW